MRKTRPHECVKLWYVIARVDARARAYLSEKHPVEVGREVNVVSQRKPSNVASEVRIGLVRDLCAQQQHESAQE